MSPHGAAHRILVCLVLAASLAVPAGAGESPEIRWEPHTARGFRDTPLKGELGRLRVPVRHADPAGDTLDLAFVRFRTTHPNPGPPIVFLAGGPGGSGIESAALMASHPQIRLLEHGDVIGMDQRGTGLTRPDLSEPGWTETLSFDEPLSRATLVAASARAAAQTSNHWTRAGVSLDAYNSAESADDLDVLRQALGEEKISLYGTSYGSHLGLAYLRRHGSHVGRAVLTKVEGPNHTWKLPGAVQNALQDLHGLTSTDPSLSERSRDLIGMLRSLLSELEQRPVRLPADDGGEAVVLGPLDLQVAVSRALAATEDIEQLPHTLEAFLDGDWTALGATARDLRHVSFLPMPLMMDCASGATPERWERIASEAGDEHNLLGDAIYAPLYPEACRAAGDPDLGDAFRQPLETPVPTLFVSGTLDVRTPPSNVEEILPGFSRGVHVVVRNAGHPARELMSREYRDLLQAFLRGEAVEDCAIQLPEPIFSRPRGDVETSD